MTKIILAGLVISSALAVEIKVKKADVVVSINTQELSLKKGDVKNLEEGTTICFLSGEGKIAVPALKKQLKKPNRCLMIPIAEDSAISYMADMKNKMTVAFWDSSESVRHGSGTKGETKFDNKGKFILSPDQNELLIFGKEFGPLPVVVILKDEKGNEVLNFENEDSEVTIVRIGRDQLKTGMNLEIYNGFESLMLSKKIVVEKNNVK